MTTADNPLPRLDLPKRWEFLSERAEKAGLDPGEFVERVDDAARRVDQLISNLHSVGGGYFEVLYGLSGSGKTTFVTTLPRFFTGIRVLIFPKASRLLDLPRFVLLSDVPGNEDFRVILIEKRDNPQQSDLADVEPMLAELLETFRDPHGRCLILWPITNPAAAELVSRSAWGTGRDSVCEPTTRGLFRFAGLPKEKYFDVADLTCRNLTGDGLDAFGVPKETAISLLPTCDTIADFFNEVNRAAESRRTQTWSVLKERVRARLWIVLPGDTKEAIQATVSALTQGTRSRADIDLIGEFLDRPDNNALYVADWRKRRAALAHLLRAIDLRLLGLPPNVSLAAVRAFGEEPAKKVLRQATVGIEQAKKTMRASRLYKAILVEAGIEVSPFAGGGDISTETENEYRRVQALSAKGDKSLNKALGLLIASCLTEDAPHLEVITEKRSLPGSQLQPDVQIKLSDIDYICLEPTWRSTDKGIENELPGGQNTLVESHIKKYLLDKATQYVRDLEL